MISNNVLTSIISGYAIKKYKPGQDFINIINKGDLSLLIDSLVDWSAQNNLVDSEGKIDFSWYFKRK